MSEVALVGLTATGKSEAAVALARRRGDVEIVSVDSMCVYRGMDLATSKPSAPVRREIRHHMVDLVEPDQEYTVAEFQAGARTAVADIAARGREALLVGGTGLYLRAVVDDLAIPGRYPDVLGQLEHQLDEGRVDVVALHARLGELDPVAAGRIVPNNRRRVLRALEVTLGSGRPFSEFGPGLEAYPPARMPMVGIAMELGVVDRRIEERFERWIDLGLVEEVRALAARREGISKTARQALGYREILAHVERGAPLDECVAEAVRRTKSFARRQAQWFRRDPRIDWVEPGPGLLEALDRALGSGAIEAGPGVPAHGSPT